MFRWKSWYFCSYNVNAQPFTKSIPKPEPRCMQCASDPSPTCMGACGLSTIMMEYESPISFCMQCASDPSPTCMGGCVRELKIEN